MRANKVGSINLYFASVTNEDIRLRYEILRLADALTIRHNQRRCRYRQAPPALNPLSPKGIMKFHRTFAQSALAVLTFSSMTFIFPQTSFATPVMDFRGEDVIPMAEELKPTLKLDANQEILWRNVEAKTRVIVREQQRRTQQLQASANQQMANPNVELRDLTPAIESDAALSSSENKQLRELWLTMNDALDDEQRQKVRLYIADRLQRASFPVSDGNTKSKSSGESSGRQGRGGMGGGMGGGGMGGGMGGGGMGGGMGGAGGSTNLSAPPAF